MRTDMHGGKAVGLFKRVLMPVLLIAHLGCGVPDSYYEKEFDRLVAESPRWREIFNVCDQIPKPADFRIVRRRMGNAHYLIVLGYESRMTIEEGFSFFDSRLKTDGWQYVGKGSGLNSTWIEYQKEGVKVTVSNGIFANGGNFGVECQAPD